MWFKPGAPGRVSHEWCFPQLEFSCQAHRDHGQVSHTERSVDSLLENGSGVHMDSESKRCEFKLFRKVIAANAVKYIL